MLHPGSWQVFFPNDYIDLYGESICSWQHAVCLAVYQVQGTSIDVNLLWQCYAVLVYLGQCIQTISRPSQSLITLEIELVQMKKEM